jgi:hypothetical protein
VRANCWGVGSTRSGKSKIDSVGGGSSESRYSSTNFARRNSRAISMRWHPADKLAQLGIEALRFLQVTLRSIRQRLINDFLWCYSPRWSAPNASYARTSSRASFNNGRTYFSALSTVTSLTPPCELTIAVASRLVGTSPHSQKQEIGLRFLRRPHALLTDMRPQLAMACTG